MHYTVVACTGYMCLRSVIVKYEDIMELTIYPNDDIVADETSSINRNNVN